LIAAPIAVEGNAFSGVKRRAVETHHFGLMALHADIDDARS